MPKTIPPGIRPTTTPELADRPVGVPVSRAPSVQGLPNRPSAVYPHFYCRLLGKAGSMLANGVRRHAVAVVGVCALGLLASACGGDAPAEPVPTSSTSSSTDGSPSATPTSSSPTSDPDAWRADFSAAQLEAYDAALARWDAYEARSEPIWAAGRATPAAEKLFKEFFPHPVWNEYWEQLKGYAAIDVSVAGTPQVLWSKAQSVSTSRTSVEIKQCVDYTPVVRTQAGEPISRPQPKPQTRTIVLNRPEGYDWLIYAVEELVQGKPKPCAA